MQEWQTPVANTATVANPGGKPWWQTQTLNI